MIVEPFNQIEFSQRVNEELAYLGMEKQHLAKCVYVSEDRIKWGLRGKLKFKPEEVRAIKKILGMN